MANKALSLVGGMVMAATTLLAQGQTPKQTPAKPSLTPAQITALNKQEKQDRKEAKDYQKKRDLSNDTIQKNGPAYLVVDSFQKSVEDTTAEIKMITPEQMMDGLKAGGTILTQGIANSSYELDQKYKEYQADSIQSVVKQATGKEKPTAIEPFAKKYYVKEVVDHTNNFLLFVSSIRQINLKDMAPENNAGDSLAVRTWTDEAPALLKSLTAQYNNSSKIANDAFKTAHISKTDINKARIDVEYMGSGVPSEKDRKMLLEITKMLMEKMK